MSLKPSATAFSLAALAAAALLAASGCLLDDKDETVKEYPIAAGRYYPAFALESASRDSANLYTDFSADGALYRDALRSRPDCTVFLLEGTWAVHTDVDDGEMRLRKSWRRGAGSSDTFGPCQTEDSLVAVQEDRSESFWLQDVTDTSFRLCDYVNEICFGKCTERSSNPGDACYGFDSARTADSYWTTWMQ